MPDNRPPLNDTNNNSGLVDLGSIPNQSPVASFNIQGINNLIDTKGFLCFHYRHSLSPDMENIGSPVKANTQLAFRGLRYYNPRALYQVPTGFKIEDQLTAQAVYGQGSVLMSVSGRYADEKLDQTGNVHIRKRDLLIFPSLTDMEAETFNYNSTGPQRLKYKAKGVDILWDSQRDYVCDQDFKITEEGFIKWINGGNRPSPGDILSIVYYYTPIYIVSNMLHHLRVIPSNSFGHAAIPREATYAPQQMVCVPSTLIEENDPLDWSAIPPLPDYPASQNTTGGSI